MNNEDLALYSDRIISLWLKLYSEFKKYPKVDPNH